MQIVGRRYMQGRVAQQNAECILNLRAARAHANDTLAAEFHFLVTPDTFGGARYVWFSGHGQMRAIVYNPLSAEPGAMRVWLSD